MDDLERRLHDLAEDVGPTRVPADLRRRVVRRRRVRTALTSAGGAAGLLLAGAVGLGVWNAQQPDPDVAPADLLRSCAADVLRTGPAQLVPDDAAAQDFSLTLDGSSPDSCTVGTFRITGADGTERVRAGLADVTLDPGGTVDLRVSWDAAATCSAQPVQLLADETVVASVAVPTCGQVTVEGSVRR